MIPRRSKYRDILFIKILLVLLVVQPSTALEDASPIPLILIYSQDSQGYGEELGSIIESDERMKARILVVSQADLLRSMLYFPYVKVVVTVFNHDRDEGLSDDLENYYHNGGGIIGMGFAGWWTTTRNASRDVFSLAANLYLTGKYNRTLGTFTHILVTDSEHEISSDVGDFTAHTQRVIMRRNDTTGRILEPEADVRVLYRETSYHAPVVILREENGVCITFGGFTGDDTEGVPTYYGHLTNQELFRKLFTNAVYYAWKNEDKYGEDADKATKIFVEGKNEIIEIRNEAEKNRARRENLRMIRHIAVFTIAALLSLIMARHFFKTRRTGGDQ